MTAGEKLILVRDATTPDLVDEVPHPLRRYQFTLTDEGLQRVADALTDQILTPEQLATVSAADLLQEFGTA